MALSGRCPSCGYDLAGSPGPRCPECGIYPLLWRAMRLEAARQMLVQLARGLCFAALLMLPLFGSVVHMSRGRAPAVPTGHFVVLIAGIAWCALIVLLVSLRPGKTGVSLSRYWLALLCVVPALLLLGALVTAEL